jgi:hypothetical protein
VSGLTLLFLVSFITIVAANIDRLLYGLPASLSAALVLPHLTSVLTIGTTAFCVLAWKGRWWTLVRRMHYSFFALAALALMWFYFHWNILGFRY